MPVRTLVVREGEKSENEQDTKATKDRRHHKQEDLLKKPYRIAGGPAANLAAAIEKLRAPTGTP